MKVIDSDLIRRILTPQRAMHAAEEAFSLLAAGQCLYYPRHVFTAPTGIIGEMPGYIAQGPHAGFGVKIIVVTKQADADMPSHNGTVTLFNPVTGLPEAVLDASAITELRTAAMSAWVTDRITDVNASTLAILGAGAQASAHIQAMRAIRPLRRVRVWARNTERLARFVADMHSQVSADCTVEACDSVAAAVADADIVCTTTGATTPIVFAECLAPHAHVNAIGASRPGAEELDTSVFDGAETYLDCREACMIESSEIQAALASKREQGANVMQDAFALRQRVSSRTPGRTVFKSVVFAAQDLVAARTVFAHCQANPETQGIASA